MNELCHAGAGHGPARSFAQWGWLCEPCWEWCLRFIARLCGADAAARLCTRYRKGTSS